MTGVQLSKDFAIVVRKNALRKKGISRTELFEAMEAHELFDEDEALLSFGPHFGEEATRELVRRLQSLGLSYGKDFLDFDDILPTWCQLYVLDVNSDTEENDGML